MEFQMTGILMRVTPEEWKAFRDRALQLAWEDDPGILESAGENAIICTEYEDEYWAYYEPRMQLLYLSHPANFTFVYPQD